MLHRLRGTGNYSFLTSVKDTFWIWKKCAETNDFLKKYKEPETILFRHVSQRYSLNMKEMYGDPLFFEEVPKNVLGSPKTTRYRQPSSAEFSRVQPSSAEFSRVRRSSAEFTPQPNSAELAWVTRVRTPPENPTFRSNCCTARINLKSCTRRAQLRCRWGRRKENISFAFSELSRRSAVASML